MTVSSAQNRAGPFSGDGVSTQFDFAVPYHKDSDISVYRRVTATGVQSQLVRGSDYSIANTQNGGRITLAAPLAVGTRLVVVRSPEPLQETDLQENDTYSAETLEKALDYNMMISQRALDLVSRALVLAESDVPGEGSYQAASNRITGLANGVLPTDAVTLAQVQAIVAAGGGAGTPGGFIPWPTLPIPPDIQDAINDGVLSNAEFQAVFTPINLQIGSLSTQLNTQIAAVNAAMSQGLSNVTADYTSQVGVLANQIIAQNATISSFSTSLSTITTTLQNQQAAIDLLEQLQGDGSEIVALIQTEQTSRIEGDAAIATVIATLGAASGDNLAFDLNLSTVRVSPTESLAQRFGSLTAADSANSAAISSESTARVSGDNALASTIAKIGALTQNGAAFLLNVDGVLVGASESLAQRLSAIGSALNANTAAISNEASVRATADQSVATQISTLQSTIGGFSTSIQQNATAINGVYAQYSVKVDNNGRIAGFGLISQPVNGSIVSTFNFNADAFNIWNGTSNVPPFSVVGGVVRANNLVVGNGNIEDLSVSKITGGTLGAEINVGGGKIIYDNGTVMRVQGTGFGTSNQFIDWYGLRPAGGNIALCSEANARWYMTTSGESFFGGEVGADVIKVGAQTTNTLADASVSIGPYTTPGNAKQIALTYSFNRRYSWSFNNGNVSTSPVSATIVLEKSTNGGSSWSTVTTLNVTGTVQFGPNAPDTYADVIMSGSQTITDNQGATSNLMFRGRMTARSLPSASGTFTSTVTTQTVEVTSTENI